ncbi:MAG: hypothetical protein ACKOWL_05275 [Sphingobacteriaceae bacterium]
MNSKNYFLAAVLGGIIYFFLGWLIYGMILVDYMEENAGPAAGVNRIDMLLWSIGLGSLLYGFLLSYIFSCVGQVKTIASGARTGAWVGFLVAGALDFTMYGTTNIATLNTVVVDILAATVMASITGAFVAWALGRESK